jgi:uncharacterized protein
MAQAAVGRSGIPSSIATAPAESNPLLREHGPVMSVALHLLPGLLTGAVYMLLRGPIGAIGYPSLVALNVAILVALVPYVMGFLLYLGYLRNGRLSLHGVLLYREPIGVRRYVTFVALGFAVSLILIAFVGEKFISPAVQATLFGWMPAVDWGLNGGYSKTVMIASYALVAVVTNICEPAVEELYFRGFLLPRMRYSGRWTVAVHSCLYAMFHLWYPWRLVTLALGMTPLVYAVRRTRNIYVGFAIHLLLNSFYLIFGVAYILGMR